MRTIAVLNQKGGVGKTTTVVNLAAALAEMGQKVLAVDLDPQAHLTIHLGHNTHRADKPDEATGTYQVLTRSAPLSKCVAAVRNNIDLLGADIDLVGAESELVSVIGRETILRQALEEAAQQYDYIIIDCPPSLGLLTLNALAASEEVLIPIQPHFLALQGFGQLLQTVSIVSRRINPKLKVSYILLCMFDARISLSTEVRADIEKFLNTSHQSSLPWSDAKIIPVHIRRNIKLAEAPGYGRTIFEYQPDCNGAEDYRLAAEFIHTGSIGQNNTDTAGTEFVEQASGDGCES